MHFVSIGLRTRWSRRSHNLRLALSIMKCDPWRKETYHVQQPIYRKCEPSLSNCLNFFRQSIMNVTRESKGQFQNITCRNPQESYIYLNEHLNWRHPYQAKSFKYLLSIKNNMIYCMNFGENTSSFRTAMDQAKVATSDFEYSQL